MAQAQPPFVAAVELPGQSAGQTAWGDYDNDGDLDLVVVGPSVAGGPRTVVYRNDGGQLVDSGISLVPVRDFAAWGDYDGDGDLDLVIGGVTHTDPPSITQLYRNDGGGALTPVASSLPAFSEDAVAAWGDYDNDGDLDLVLAGFSDPDYATRLYRNDHGVFTDTDMGLAPGLRASVAWGDYDGDGDLDLVVGSGMASQTILYRNDGGTLVDSGVPLPRCESGSLAWADYDGDGDLDLALTGTSWGLGTRIYRNDGGSFVDSGVPLVGAHYGSVSWADADGDGDSDLLVTGSLEDGAGSRFYRNDGGGSFVPIESGIPWLANSRVAWGDFDGDHRLEVAAVGDSFELQRAITVVYRYPSATENAPPSLPAPVGVVNLADPTSVQLVWSPASDATTPGPALGYNVRVGTTPGGSEVMSAMADPATGYRRVVAAGNAGQATRFTLRGLPEGVYYWAVQALDTSFAGSPFATEQSFVISTGGGGEPLPVVVAKMGSGRGRVTSTPAGIDCGETCTASFPPSYTVALVATPEPGSTFAGWGGACSGSGPCFVAPSASTWVAATFESPSYPVDVTVAGTGTVFSSPGGIYCGDYCAASFPAATSLTLVATPAPGFAFAGWTGACTGALAWCTVTVDGPLSVGATFVVPPFELVQSLTGVDNGSVAWGDYDGDGRLDLAVVGMTETAAETLTRVYRNAGGQLVDSGAGLLNADNVADQADYDNDGDLDLLAGGWSPAPTKVTSSSSTVTTPARSSRWPPGCRPASACPPSRGATTTATAIWTLAIAGSKENGWQARLYRNDHGWFVEAHVLPPMLAKSVAWGDYDRDGDLDLLVAGDYQRTYVCRNDDGAFTDIGASLLAVNNGAAQWVDFNGDGWVDIVVSGIPWGGAATARLYENDASGSFAEVASPFPGDYKPPSWADYDNDGDQDALVCAADGTRLYRNDGGVFADAVAGLPQVWNGRCAWGDLDGDGRLEVVLSGYASSSGERRADVYRSSVATANTAPAPPTGPSASVTEGSVRLQWGPSSDLETPSPALTYNVRVGTTPDGHQVLAAMADGATGFRRIVGPGNAGSEMAMTLRGLAPGQYYFAVQAVDGGFAGSAFSAVVPFAVTTEQPLTVALSGTGTGVVASTPPGIDCGPSCAAVFPSGTVVTLTATPGSGSAF
ncbi:MAG: FG-GAP-like repeat-containing protein, partial [Vicinamibacteria bacterium]